LAIAEFYNLQQRISVWLTKAKHWRNVASSTLKRPIYECPPLRPGLERSHGGKRKTLMCCGEGELFVSQFRKSYVGLATATTDEDGSRTIAIRRFGALEVRLVEFAARQQADSLDIWIELYDYDTQTSLDSCLCHDIDEAEPMLEHLLSSARRLTEPPVVPK
jgi:hypothetical protein